MKTDRDWDIAKLEVEAKNDNLIGKWLMEKAGNRYGVDNKKPNKEVVKEVVNGNAKEGYGSVAGNPPDSSSETGGTGF